MLPPLSDEMLALTWHQELDIRAAEQQLPNLSREELEAWFLLVLRLSETRLAMIRYLTKRR